MKVSSSHAVKGIALLASVVVLAGCNQGGDNDNSQATNQPTSVVTKSSTATPSSESTATSEDSSSDVAESDEQDAAEAEDSNGKTAAQQRKDQESCKPTRPSFHHLSGGNGTLVLPLSLKTNHALHCHGHH